MKKKELAKRLTNLEWLSACRNSSVESRNDDLRERHETLTDTVKLALERIKALEETVERLSGPRDGNWAGTPKRGTA